MDSVKGNVSLRAAYNASMAKAINDTREGCRELFADKKGPWLMNPMSVAVRSEVRAGLDHLPQVLVDLIDSFGDFVDAECFICAMPEVIKSVRDRTLLQSTIMMAITLDNLEMFNKLGSYYSRSGKFVPEDYYAEFSEFREANNDSNMFRQTVINVICYCGRGETWLASVNCNSIEKYVGAKFALMGLGSS